MLQYLESWFGMVKGLVCWMPTCCVILVEMMQVMQMVVVMQMPMQDLKEMKYDVKDVFHPLGKGGIFPCRHEVVKKE